MSNTVVLKNELGCKEVIKFQYTENNGNYDFELDIEGGGEYGVLFVYPNNKYYTAAITAAKKGLAFSVDSAKLMDCRKVQVIDINTEAELFTASFIAAMPDMNVLGGSKDLPKQAERAAPPCAEISQEAALCENAAAFVCLDSNEKDNIQDEETQCKIVTDENDKKKKSSEIKQYARKFFNKQYPSVYLSECKRLFKSKLKQFDLLNSLSEHTLYVYDEIVCEEADMRIVMNKGVVPINKLYLHYVNRFLSADNALPKRIVGTATLETGNEYYVFGVLGERVKEQQPFMGATGFVYFNSVEGSKYGYWMMYINAKTGKIATPISPVEFG